MAPVERMALQGSDDIHASAALRAARERQRRALMPWLQREAARRALQVGVARDDAAPPLLGVAWTHLWLAGGEFHGELRAHADAALPFIDDAFDLVWLQHALEPAPPSVPVLREACRVLAAGGVLAITAVHPCSGWAPWFRWHARRQRQTLQWPWRLRAELADAGLDTEVVRRLGPFWPHADGRDSRFGGVFLLLARKRRQLAMPITLRPLPVGLPANAQWSPGTRRQNIS